MTATCSNTRNLLCLLFPNKCLKAKLYMVCLNFSPSDVYKTSMKQHINLSFLTNKFYFLPKYVGWKTLTKSIKTSHRINSGRSSASTTYCQTRKLLKNWLNSLFMCPDNREQYIVTEKRFSYTGYPWPHVSHSQYLMRKGLGRVSSW